jgi:hypothetical protein
MCLHICNLCLTLENTDHMYLENTDHKFDK